MMKQNNYMMLSKYHLTKKGATILVYGGRCAGKKDACEQYRRKLKQMKERTFLGNLMYNVITSTSCRLTNHMWLYYLLNYTWGLPMVLFGYFVLLLLLLTGHKLHRKYGLWYVEAKIGSGWGVSLGTIIIVSKDCIDNSKMLSHEFGHTCQNALLGPFQIFLVDIPSAIRFWYRIVKEKRHPGSIKTAYDDIWFEGSATDIGNYDYLNRRKIKMNKNK